ncbi:MAG: hypothetical protein N2C14_18175, partial [Planctomycetales bacterium]
MGFTVAFTKVIDVTSPFLGGKVLLSGLEAPVVEGDDLAFVAAAANWKGLCRYSQGEIQLLADVETNIPGGSGCFVDFNNVVTKDGVIGFQGLGAKGQEGIFLTGGELRCVVNNRMRMPGSRWFFSRFERPSLGENRVAFRTLLTGGKHAIFLQEEEDYSALVDDSTIVPGGVDTFTRLSRPCMLGDSVVFVGSGAKGGAGVFDSRDGMLEVIANNRTAVPGGQGKFLRFSVVSRHDRSIAFAADGSGAQQGIYKKETDVDVAADRTMDIPEGRGKFIKFEEFS